MNGVYAVNGAVVTCVLHITNGLHNADCQADADDGRKYCERIKQCNMADSVRNVDSVDGTNGGDSTDTTSYENDADKADEKNGTSNKDG